MRETAVTAAQQRLGKFIIAPNELDPAQLSRAALLENYKAQSVSKNPLFFAQSLFLKSPARLMALIMVMGLALLIFALGERQLRQALSQQQETVRDQKGQPTAMSTLRWVFQLFEGLDVPSVCVTDLLKLYARFCIYGQFISKLSASWGRRYKNAIGWPHRGSECGIELSV